MVRVPLVVVALTFAIVSCGTSSGTGDGSSGIKGTAGIGPMCPVMVAESPCPDRPFDGVIRVRSTDGDIVAEGHTTDGGTFRIALEPGTYVVEPVLENSGAPPFAKPVTVTVPAGSFVEVAVTIDSGIR
jgi:hypothetical protein